MATERDALMREVDEELRRDQAQKIWDRYGTYIIAAVAALLVAVAGWKWWEGRRLAAAEAAGSRFEAALNLIEGGKGEDAAKELATIAATSRSSYAMLADLARAGESVKEAKSDQALSAFDAAAARTSDTLIRDYARLQSVALKIDTVDFTEAQNRLNDLMAEKNPWRYLARELLGVAAIRSGKLDEARGTLAPLSTDPRAPAAVRERAGALMNLVVTTELERTVSGKVEFEKTDPPAGTAPETPPAKAEPPRGKAAPSKGGAAPRAK